MKNKRNPHNFPVLQQDIPASHNPKANVNKVLPSKNVRNQTNENHVENTNLPAHPVSEPNQNFGNFFDEVVPRDENRKEEGAMTVEQQAQKKEKKKLFSFKPDLLLDPVKGLKALYMNIDKFSLVKPENTDQNKNNNPNQNVDEFHLLHKMMRLIKDWHFLCMPKYDFNYFLNRCQEFGTKPILRSHLTRMRKIHKGVMTWEDIENDHEGTDQNANNNYQNSFVPQELLDNIRNRNSQPQNNEQIPSSQNQGNIKPPNQTQNHNITPSFEPNLGPHNSTTNYEEIHEEVIDNEDPYDEREIPAEVMNAPDIDFDDDIDLDVYDLERERKKIKNDEPKI